MRRTAFGVIYDLKDTTALQDSTPSTMDNQDFAVEYLLRDNTAFPDYQTLEQDYFVLDGTMPELPDDPEKIPFWTSQMSGADGIFLKNPVLTILFEQNHTSAGLTFHFVGDAPLQMEVRWYDLAGNMMGVKSYEIDSIDYYARNLVENYGRIEIEFTRALPYRYVKLWGLDYGTTLHWKEDAIKTAALVEETDPISANLKENKLTFQICDTEGEFDFSNENGLHKALQKNQYMQPYEEVNGERRSLGRYFLSAPSVSKGLAKFTASDYIGMLENTDFTEGRVYDGEPARDVLAEIFSGTDIPYSVDEDVAVMPLYGYLKIQTRRKALREVLFACGAAAETSRQDDVHIFRPDRKIRSTIAREQKFSTAVKKDDYVSDVIVKYASYVLETEEKEILKAAQYPAGENTVRFSSPVEGVRISAGKISEAKPGYLIFNLDAASEVTIYGKTYVRQEASATAAINDIKAGECRKSKTYTSELCDYGRAKKLAEAILAYYQLSLILDVRFLAENEVPCAWSEIENADREHASYCAGIESITTDLTGGYISKAKLRGYYKEVTESYFTDSEIYTGEAVGDL